MISTRKLSISTRPEVDDSSINAMKQFSRRSHREKVSPMGDKSQKVPTTPNKGVPTKSSRNNDELKKDCNGPISRARRAIRCNKASAEPEIPGCWCEDASISSEAAACAFRALGDRSFDENDFEGALLALNHELTIKRLTLGSGDAEVGRVLNHMAVRMTSMGSEYEFFALSAFAEALSNLQDSVGPGDEEAAIVAHNLWVLLHNVRVRQEEELTKQAHGGSVNSLESIAATLEIF